MTTAQKAYKEVSQFTAEDMEKMRRQFERDTNLAEVFVTFGVVVFLAGLFIGMFIRTLWV